ncbi:MAG: sensor histidine kinase [Myxococcales bacterium]
MEVSVPGGEDVLVVDDEPAIRMVFEYALTEAGVRVHSVESLAAAREAIATRTYALALVDKNLRDGNGMRLLEELRERSPDTEVIVITGFANVDSAVEALRLGARDYIVKPFDHAVIVHRVCAVLGHRRAVRESARLRESLMQAKQLANLGMLAAGVGHELGTPLTFLCGNIELGVRAVRELQHRIRSGEAIDPVDVESLTEVMTEVERGSERLRNVLDDLRRLSRQGGSEPLEQLDLRAVADVSLRFASTILWRRSHVRRDFREVPPVRGHVGRIGQVLLNLLLNAAQAIPEGAREENEIRVVTRTDEEGRAVVEVVDTGRGLSPEIEQALFKPFFTTRPDGGTGLRLSICQHIVEQLGGEIRGERLPERGSVFRVVLPPAVVAHDAPQPQWEHL